MLYFNNFSTLTPSNIEPTPEPATTTFCQNININKTKIPSPSFMFYNKFGWLLLLGFLSLKYLLVNTAAAEIFDAFEAQGATMDSNKNNNNSQPNRTVSL